LHAGAALAMTAPAASAQAGRQLSILAWPGYFPPDRLAAFAREIDFRIAITTVSSNAELFSRLAHAPPGSIDLILPSLHDSWRWQERPDLLQPIDLNRLEPDRVEPALWRASARLGALHQGARMMVPAVWGSEGLCWDSGKSDGAPRDVSYARLWSANHRGAVALRAKSALIGLALWLDRTDQLPSERLEAAYADEGLARQIFAGLRRFLEEHPEQVGSFWTDRASSLEAFRMRGCSIGQLWDQAALQLAKDSGGRYRFALPREGGLGWIDAFAIPAATENRDAAYAFIEFFLRPEEGAALMAHSGFGSAAAGALGKLTGREARLHLQAHPPSALEAMWWWRREPPWIAALLKDTEAYWQSL